MAFLYRLEDEDRATVEPHTFKTAAPLWAAWRRDPAAAPVATGGRGAGRRRGSAPTLAVEDVP
jgi:hypothetical protein